MSEKEKILKLFPQPLFKYQVEDYKVKNKKLLDYIYELYEEDNLGVQKSNINGWHSKSFDLQDKKNIPNEFFANINPFIVNVFKNYGWVYDPSKIVCTSMWAIINKKGNFNIEHTHPNNYLSAAYYVKAPDNCGNFKATNPNILDRHIRAKSNQPNELNSISASIKVNEGDLLIFPAYLPHSVEENKSDEDRVIISFNIDILK